MGQRETESDREHKKEPVLLPRNQFAVNPRPGLTGRRAEARGVDRVAACVHQARVRRDRGTAA